MDAPLSRRQFMIRGAGIALAISLPAWATDLPQAVKATAITEIFGEGAILTAVALEYREPVSAVQLSVKDFSVSGRTVTDVLVNDSMALNDKAQSGRYVIVKLSPDDANLSLKEMIPMANSTVAGGPKSGAKWVAGDKPQDNLVFKVPQAEVKQQGGSVVNTSAVKYLIADDFEQRVFRDPQTGRSLRYNLFVPKNKDNKPLPLVLFMHDAGVTSEFHTATLLQGLGAVVWASPEEQAKRPCFVLAPQYDEIIVYDNSRASEMLDITIRLLHSLQRQYRIDPKRLYATGQSGGCMMAMAMNIKYPDLFAAAYLVAGKWSADLVAPMAKKKLWFMASVDDKGAFPSMNAITERLERLGAKVSRAWWDAKWSDSEYRYAADALLAEKSQMYYTAYSKGTVFTTGESQAGASGHRNTWKYAYSIESVREWLFAQKL